MPLSGMTGFARADGERAGVRWTWEARSVNSKGLDIRLRLPPGLERLEPKAREAVQARFARGSVSATLQTKRETETARLRVNTSLAAQYAAAARALVRRGLADPMRADGLLDLRGVIEADAGVDDSDALDAVLLEGFTAAMDALAAARREEGAALAPVLCGAVDRIAALRADAEACASAQPQAIRERLAQRIAEIDVAGLSEERFAQEAAFLASKADIREELDRLAAHVDAARALLADDKPVGRKLDFLAQEFMREANTLCSKSADIALTRIGLELKSAIEQLREQIQNVE